MAKVIECFSLSPSMKFTLYCKTIVEFLEDNGMVIQSLEDAFPITVNVALREGIRDIKKKIFDIKMQYVNDDGFLFIATDEKNLFGYTIIHPEKFKSLIIREIKVGRNTLYIDDKYSGKSVVYDEKLVDKIELVYDKIKSICDTFDYNHNYNNLKVIGNTVNVIKVNYTNTGIITKDDLRWLNKIYNNLDEDKKWKLR